MAAVASPDTPDTPDAGRSGGMSPQRRDRIRLEISREAARLFWAQGVPATTGEQIADAVGLSVRTIWRHFRSKESCAEPIVTQNVRWLLAVLRDWPPQSTLEDHFASELTRRSRNANPAQAADDLLSVQMVELARTEPAIRSAWLMACDQVEIGMVAIIAARLPDVTNPEVRVHAAAATAAVRVVNEDISTDLLAGEADRIDIGAVSGRLARAVRTATGGAVGDPVRP